MQKIYQFQLTQNQQSFQLDNLYKFFDYVYLSKVTIPIDFYLFQTGYEYISFTIYINEFDPGALYQHYFNLGSPSAFDLEIEINNFLQNALLDITCEFQQNIGKFKFTSIYYDFEINVDDKTQQIIGNLSKTSNTEYNSQNIANLIFHQQLNIKTDLTLLDINANIEQQNQIFQILNLQNYNIFDFPEITFNQQNNYFNKKTQFLFQISYSNNFNEEFTKQSQIPIFFELVFTKKDDDLQSILLSQLLKEQQQFNDVIKLFIKYYLQQN